MAKNSSLAIGQIVYILSDKTQTILPAKIVEKTVIQTLNDDKVSWKLAIGFGAKQKIVDSKRIKGEIFENLNDIEKLLTEKLGTFINKIMRQAQAWEQQWYETPKNKKEEKENSQASEENDQEKIDPESLINDFDIPLPTNNSPITESSNERLSPEEQRERLRNMVADDDEEEPKTTYITPDGEKVPINLKV